MGEVSLVPRSGRVPSRLVPGFGSAASRLVPGSDPTPFRLYRVYSPERESLDRLIEEPYLFVRRNGSGSNSWGGTVIRFISLERHVDGLSR